MLQPEEEETKKKKKMKKKMVEEQDKEKNVVEKQQEDEYQQDSSDEEVRRWRSSVPFGPSGLLRNSLTDGPCSFSLLPSLLLVVCRTSGTQ